MTYALILTLFAWSQQGNAIAILPGFPTRAACEAAARAWAADRERVALPNSGRSAASATCVEHKP